MFESHVFQPCLVYKRQTPIGEFNILKSNESRTRQQDNSFIKPKTSSIKPTTSHHQQKRLTFNKKHEQDQRLKQVKLNIKRSERVIQNHMLYIAMTNAKKEFLVKGWELSRINSSWCRKNAIPVKHLFEILHITMDQSNFPKELCRLIAEYVDNNIRLVC